MNVRMSQQHMPLLLWYNVWIIFFMEVVFSRWNRNARCRLNISPFFLLLQYKRHEHITVCPCVYFCSWRSIYILPYIYTNEVFSSVVVLFCILSMEREILAREMNILGAFYAFSWQMTVCFITLLYCTGIIQSGVIGTLNTNNKTMGGELIYR